ncbi:helix-turn-helix domain-containing protein [Galbibacter sp. EGI 63066]|uniref:helix-turn-helix domain-containing protein n=1 Tax=Galbibacter sp. EGI 63066 TaxID=2993559 RepID=UPI002249419C|nr:helix-turn-helix domain-containing protein [Galbibacter sp. EGI 63066]MCX2680645.1 helix-turn-helix domain-containing protein [Galbibacter sp. EGI 63066]
MKQIYENYSIFGFESEIFLLSLLFFVIMVDRNRKIVEYIAAKWISKVTNNSEFADKNNIGEKTVRSIRDDKSYRTSFETIENICVAQNMNLSDFFKEAEEMFPEIKIKK